MKLIFESFRKYLKESLNDAIMQIRQLMHRMPKSVFRDIEVFKVLQNIDDPESREEAMAYATGHGYDEPSVDWKIRTAYDVLFMSPDKPDIVPKDEFFQEAGITEDEFIGWLEEHHDRAPPQFGYYLYRNTFY